MLVANGIRPLVFKKKMIFAGRGGGIELSPQKNLLYTRYSFSRRIGLPSNPQFLESSQQMEIGPFCFLKNIKEYIFGDGNFFPKRSHVYDGTFWHKKVISLESTIVQ